MTAEVNGVRWLAKADIAGQAAFIDHLFGLKRGVP
jgi:hypothetical protein